MQFLYILLAIALFLVLITVHERGHYTAGKLLGFKINEFSIGFGKALFKKTNKKTGEVFSLRVFPLGGYCAFEGEDEEGNEHPQSFNKQKPWKRIIVLSAGVFFNLIFGILSAAVFLMVSGYAVPKISYINPNSPNAQILMIGDEIESVNGKSVEAYRSLEEMISGIGTEKDIVLTIKRDGEKIKVTVQKFQHEGYFFLTKPEDLEKVFVIATGEVATMDDIFLMLEEDRENFASYFKNEEGEVFTNQSLAALLNIGEATEGTNLGIVFNHASRSYGFFESLGKAFPLCGKIALLILQALGGLFVGKTAISDLGGTITTISQIAELSSFGIEAILYLIPVLSINLALFNFLPIPALDGARVVFVAIEGIFKKPVPRKIEGYIHMIGLFVLLGFVVFLDIYHFFIL